jgi:hypothetical protein
LNSIAYEKLQTAMHPSDELTRRKNKINACNAKHMHSMLISKDGLSNDPI